MRSLALIIFLLVGASSSVFAVKNKNVDMTEFEYRRYVRPQLRSILQDYQTLLLLLNPEFSNFKSSFSDVRKILKSRIYSKGFCHQEEIQACLIELKKVKSLLLSLKKASHNPVNYTKIKHLTLDQKLRAENHITDYQQKILKAKISIENLTLETRLISNKEISLKEVRFLTKDVVTHFYMIVTDFSDNRFNNDLNIFWSSFYMPVLNYVLMGDQKEFFLNNIKKFNISWNSLNVRLTKRNKKISKQVNTLISVMHRRWNNILKVSLNPMEK